MNFKFSILSQLESGRIPFGATQCIIRSEFSASLCAYLCAPLRLNFTPQFATILHKAVLRELEESKS